MVFSIFTDLYNHEHSQFQYIFVTPKRKPIRTSTHWPFLLKPTPFPESPWQSLMHFSLYGLDLPIPLPFIYEINHEIRGLVCLNSLSIMFSSSIHVGACISTSFCCCDFTHLKFTLSRSKEILPFFLSLMSLRQSCHCRIRVDKSDFLV